MTIRVEKIILPKQGKNSIILLVGGNIEKPKKYKGTGDFQMKVITQIEAARSKVVYELFSETTNGTERYGIKIRSELFTEAEEAAVKDITSELDFAEKLLFMLADNLVLPSTADEVIEEYLASAFTVNN